MIKSLPLLCVFIFNACAQCTRVENNLYYYPDNTFLLKQTRIERVVYEKPDYFPPVPAENKFSSLQPSASAGAPVFSAVHAAILSRYNAFCKTLMAGQSGVSVLARRCTQIVYVKIPCNDSPEDVPLFVA